MWFNFVFLIANENHLHLSRLLLSFIPFNLFGCPITKLGGLIFFTQANQQQQRHIAKVVLMVHKSQLYYWLEVVTPFQIFNHPISYTMYSVVI